MTDHSAASPAAVQTIRLGGPPAALVALGAVLLLVACAFPIWAIVYTSLNGRAPALPIGWFGPTGPVAADMVPGASPAATPPPGQLTPAVPGSPPANVPPESTPVAPDATATQPSAVDTPPPPTGAAPDTAQPSLPIPDALLPGNGLPGLGVRPQDILPPGLEALIHGNALPANPDTPQPADAPDADPSAAPDTEAPPTVANPQDLLPAWMREVLNE